MAQPERYEAWYHTPRGRWIGEREFRLLAQLLRPKAGESMLDVGCGTGYFTRRFASESDVQAIGLDPNVTWLQFARAHALAAEHYCAGRAEALPFADRSFDCTISVTALCFVADQQRALREMLRVTRKRFAIGLLNRHSLLYLRKRNAGVDSEYHSARWHTQHEIRELLAALPTTNLVTQCAVLLPNGGWWARSFERFAAKRLPFGAFLAVAGRVQQQGMCDDDVSN